MRDQFSVRVALLILFKLDMFNFQNYFIDQSIQSIASLTKLVYFYGF